MLEAHFSVTGYIYILKRYKSCHWGSNFSKGTCLYLKGTFWYLEAPYYLKCTYLNLIGTKVYLLKSDRFYTFISESAGQVKKKGINGTHAGKVGHKPFKYNTQYTQYSNTQTENHTTNESITFT